MRHIRYFAPTILTLAILATVIAYTRNFYDKLSEASQLIVTTIHLDLWLLAAATVVLLALRRRSKSLKPPSLTQLPGALRKAFTGKSLALYALVWLSGQTIYLSTRPAVNDNPLQQALLDPHLPGWFLAGFILLLAPLTEEVIIRGVVLNALLMKLPTLPAALISAGVFALLHGDPKKLPYTFALGLTLTIFYLSANTLVAPILAHCAFNLLSTVVPAQIITALASSTITLVPTVGIYLVLIIILCKTLAQQRISL